MAEAVPPSDAALRRVLRQTGVDILDVLGHQLSGADLTTLLMAAARLRAGHLTPADVLRRYQGDRFTTPATVPFGDLRRAEDALLAALPAEFEVLTLAPVTPLGTHSVLGTVDQNKVISTIRSTEVAADPTNGLALEAATRRQLDPRADAPVRLAALQRVLRAQQFDGPASFAHFSLLGLVSAGRDTGGFGFEQRFAVEQLQVICEAMRAAGAERTELRLTTLETRYVPVTEAIRAALSGRPDVWVDEDPDRASGRGYYIGLCFKVFTTIAGQRFEVADGGLVDWTQKLLNNRKERLFISGIGIDRLATALASSLP
jgi:hypothetical protein